MKYKLNLQEASGLTVCDLVMSEGKCNSSQRDRGHNNSDLSVGREGVLYQGKQRERIQPYKGILRRRRAYSGKSISKCLEINLVLGNRNERQNNEVTKMKCMKFQLEYNESASHTLTNY